MRRQVALKAAEAEGGADNFSKPVTDEVAPRYSEIINQPMDLGKVAEKLGNGSYRTSGTYLSSLRTFDASILAIQQPLCILESTKVSTMIPAGEEPPH